MTGLRNTVRGDELWDGEGRRWQRGRPRWLDARSVGRWVRRGGVIACQGPLDDQLTWWTPAQAAAWWARSAAALEVPGTATAATADGDGRTYGALLWRCGEERMLGVQIFC